MCRWTSELQAIKAYSVSERDSDTTEHNVPDGACDGSSAMTSLVQHVLKADEPGTSEIAQSWVGVAT